MLYDRQVQIFGEGIQQEILQSCLAIQGLTAFLTETLKNGVLMGFNVELDLEANKGIKIQPDSVHDFYFLHGFNFEVQLFFFLYC